MNGFELGKQARRNVCLNIKLVNNTLCPHLKFLKSSSHFEEQRNQAIDNNETMFSDKIEEQPFE